MSCAAGRSLSRSRPGSSISTTRPSTTTPRRRSVASATRAPESASVAPTPTSTPSPICAGSRCGARRRRSRSSDKPMAMSASASSSQIPVVIIGAGPAGLLLSQLLDLEGVDSVLLEARSREYVLNRIRAGVLESSTVELLEAAGVGDRLRREGMEHRGIYLQWPEERHHVDFVDLVGRSVWIYGQTQVTKDLMRAREAVGQEAYYDVSDVSLDNRERDRPAVRFGGSDGVAREITARAIAGCDGYHGPARPAVPDRVQRIWEHGYPYAWLGILADVAPSTDELIYAWHPDGFALHSMRSESVSRLDVQVDSDDDIANWSDDRIWDALATRLGDGQDGWRLTAGPVLEKGIL